jgi:hypothetical protein
MPNEEDFVPKNDEKFNIYFKNLCQLTGERTTGTNPPWDHVPAAAVTTLNNSYAAWYAVYAVTLKPHTPLDTEAKNRAKTAGTEEIRSFVNEYIRYSSKVSVEDRERVGVFGRTPPHPVPRPTTVPDLDPKAGNPRQIVISYRDKGSEHRGKPKGVHGLELRWAFLDHEPKSIAELVNSSFDTRSPLILTFGEEDRGKRIYMAGRWEINREGEKGDFGDIVSAIVP